MIRFPCLCKHPFNLEDNLAGGLVQCPACGRLNDVPTLSDLKNLTADGLYPMDAPEVKDEPHRLKELQTAFSRQRTAADGQQIDLRPTMEDVLAAGADHVPIELVDELRPAAPKYDPVTGELIRPIDIRHDPDRPLSNADIPLAMAALNYARPDLSPRINAGSIVRQLFTPANLFVMFAILAMHAIVTTIGMIGLGIGFLLAAPLMVMILVIIVSHYANVIEDIGPDNKDELPRPMRNSSLYEDMMRPFGNVMLAFIYCYGQSVFLLLYWPGRHGTVIAAFALAALGTILFPAVLLTSTTSGTILNLSIPRVFGVISAIGVRYLLIIGLYCVATFVMLMGLAGTAADMAFWMTRSHAPPFYLSGIVGYTILSIGIYLMHAFCWAMGLTYRAHHAQFPWVLQRHIRTRADGPPSRPHLGRSLPPPPVI